MSEKTNLQILKEIEVHTSNAVKLLNRAQEIHTSALDLDDIDAYIAAMKRAVALQEFSTQEMQKAVHLQTILTQRISSLEYLRSKFGMF